jgi:hypothetical protein
VLACALRRLEAAQGQLDTALAVTGKQSAKSATIRSRPA